MGWAALGDATTSNGMVLLPKHERATRVTTGQVPSTEAATTHRGDQARDARGQFVQTPESVARDAEALRLRSRGKSLNWISENLGYGSASNVNRAITRAVQAVQGEAVVEVRQQQLELLDHLTDQAMTVLERHHVTIQGGRVVMVGPAPEEGEEDTRSPLLDDGPVLQAIQTLLRIQERRAKLLGLDAPQKVDSVVATLPADDAGVLDVLARAREAADARLAEVRQS